ncbi:TraR/DksA C4-type zinc finger protein [Aeromonas salmonicida]|uniref:TraR/DksA C4-type zinc finger protein n=1 Tax=Aeromonas salmonicida TaxID=645 RepID=A0AAX3VUD2_AERSA|nr:TraR/DksA C4-type zinc finger protein [Aeromonas salmonicida]WHF37515.1 TraR/DksA C4-type zinc finger protein [Aeromonas salmonicida]
MVPSWRDQARGNSGSRDDRLTFSCQCHLGEQLHDAIPPSRLAAEPGAERCIECQTLYERKEAVRVGIHR